MKALLKDAVIDAKFASEAEKYAKLLDNKLINSNAQYYANKTHLFSGLKRFCLATGQAQNQIKELKKKREAQENRVKGMSAKKQAAAEELRESKKKVWTKNWIATFAKQNEAVLRNGADLAAANKPFKENRYRPAKKRAQV